MMNGPVNSDTNSCTMLSFVQGRIFQLRLTSIDCASILLRRCQPCNEQNSNHQLFSRKKKHIWNGNVFVERLIKFPTVWELKNGNLVAVATSQRELESILSLQICSTQSLLFRGAGLVHFHPNCKKKKSSKITFIQRHFDPKSQTSNDIFIQNRGQCHPRDFHPKTVSSDDTFIQKTVSSKFPNHQTPKPQTRTPRPGPPTPDPQPRPPSRGPPSGGPPKFRVFFPLPTLFRFFFEFPRSFVELRWSLRVFMDGRSFTRCPENSKCAFSKKSK